MSHLTPITSLSISLSLFTTDGLQGSGKTSTLLHAVNYCLNEGWFIFFVPSVRHFAVGKSTVIKQLGTQIYSQPEAGLTQFQQLKTLNPHLFDKLTLQRDHRLGETFTASGRKLVTVTQGMTFAKVAEVAAANPQISSQALVALLEELEGQAEVPVLVAIDDVNYLFGATRYDDPDDPHQFKKQKLTSARFQLLAKLAKLATREQAVKSGAVVSALSRTIDNVALTDGTLHLEHQMDELKRRSGVVPVRVGNFDREEQRACLEHFRHAGLFSQKGPFGEHEFHRLRLLSGGNGKELFKVVSGYF